MLFSANWFCDPLECWESLSEIPFLGQIKEEEEEQQQLPRYPGFQVKVVYAMEALERKSE